MDGWPPIKIASGRYCSIPSMPPSTLQFLLMSVQVNAECQLTWTSLGDYLSKITEEKESNEKKTEVKSVWQWWCIVVIENHPHHQHFNKNNNKIRGTENSIRLPFVHIFRKLKKTPLSLMEDSSSSACHLPNFKRLPCGCIYQVTIKAVVGHSKRVIILLFLSRWRRRRGSGNLPVSFKLKTYFRRLIKMAPLANINFLGNAIHL